MPDTPQPSAQSIEGGGIVYDAARLSKPASEVFTASYWTSRQALTLFAGGRGTVAIIRPDALFGEWVLRHYRRGGFAARVSSDRYLWLGERRTRSFSEWRLLLQLRQMGLPVPRPIAARYLRHGLVYTADLITERIPTPTLAERLMSGDIADADWVEVGRTVARFHAAGVRHADLNANNILLDGTGCYLLDFDRGKIQSQGKWESAVLARLKRSLEKIKRDNPTANFRKSEWALLLKGYASPATGTVGDANR